MHAGRARAPEKSPASDSPLMLTTMHGASRVQLSLLALAASRAPWQPFFLSFA
jgi:hypothetical protein